MGGLVRILPVLVCLALPLYAGAGAKEDAGREAREAELSQVTGIEQQVLALVKKESGSVLSRMHGYDPDGYQIKAKGITVAVSEEKAEPLLGRLRRRLARRGYMAFIIEVNEKIKTASLGVVKGTDQFDILRIMHTNGNDSDISNQDIIDRLQEWKRTAPLDIIGAENGWVEIEFKTLPKDMRSFAAEVYEFCPDTVDRDAGSIAELERQIKRTRRLMLWWE